MSVSCNIASHLPVMAAAQARQGRAGAADRNRERWSADLALDELCELDALSDSYAAGLESIGLVRGTRTILMVKPSAEFFGLVFALYKLGAPVVMIDPGMGKQALKKCLSETEP